MSSVALINASKTFPLARSASLATEVRRWPAGDPEAERGDVTALDSVTLTIADGESVAVLGPSGCGKSTLLRIVAGLEPPDSGQVHFDGEDVTATPAQERGIGMVFQSYALYPHMDSKRNLGFFFKMHRREPETEERVAAVCEIMGPGFRDLLNRRPNELSGGQRQRVALGRCVIRDPRVFLFDEPLSNLDAKLRAHTRVEIKRLIRRFGITSIYVTHDQTEAIAICERIAVMRDGRIEQVGRYADLYDRPVSAFVAGFFGTPPMSLVDGVVSLSGETVEPRGVASPGSVLLPLPPSLAGRLAPGTPVTVGSRPEAVRVVAAGSHEPGTVPALSVVGEPLPAERRQHLTCSLGVKSPRDRSAEVIARLESTDRIPAGTPVSLVFEAEQLHLFGADGRRL